MARSQPTVAQLQRLARTYARRAGIDPNVFVRQINTESGFQTGVTSSAGAQGIAQFMPGTAKSNNVNPWDPRSALRGAARLDATLVKQTGSLRNALAAYNAGPGNIKAGLGYADKILGGQSSPSTGPGGGSSGTSTTPGVNRSGDRRSAILNYLLNQQRQDSSGAGLVGLTEQLQGLQDTPAKTVRSSSNLSSPGGTTTAKGVATFEGKKVAAWIAPLLKQARAAGWKGTVSSGYRSFADQTRIYNSGVRPAAKPGTSNHEGTQYPRGAVDVTDAAQLSAILKKLGAPLQWAGAKDPVHFSVPHNGSY